FVQTIVAITIDIATQILRLAIICQRLKNPIHFTNCHNKTANNPAITPARLPFASCSATASEFNVDVARKNTAISKSIFIENVLSNADSKNTKIIYTKNSNDEMKYALFMLYL